MLTSKMGLEVAEAEAFITAMFKVVNEGLKEDKLVKIKGLGTFKLTKVSARESVDVNTGERIVIEGREKISFTPDNYMRDLVNSPFSQFETVVLSDGVDFSAIDEKYALNELEDDSSLLLSNEESLEPIADEPKSILSSIEEAKEALAQLNEKEEEGIVVEPVLSEELETENLLVVEQEESNEETKEQVSAPISLQLSPQQLSALNTKESVSDREEKVEESEVLSAVVENESSQIEKTPQIVIDYINNHYARPIVATDVGQNQLWTTQFLEIKGQHQMLTSGGLGTMGYGFPAALGAQIGNPDKRVFAICGDGGVQMNIQEFATAMHYRLPVTLIILNNGFLGNVRQWQQLFYDKRYACTNLLMDESSIVTRDMIDNDEFEYVPNFVQLAEAYGAKAMRITKVEDIEKGFQLADTFKDGPTLLEFIIPTELNVLPMVPAGKSLSDMLLKDKK